MKIHKEGYQILGFTSASLIGLNLLLFALLPASLQRVQVSAGLLSLFFGLILQFFRFLIIFL